MPTCNKVTFRSLFNFFASFTENWESFAKTIDTVLILWNETHNLPVEVNLLSAIPQKGQTHPKKFVAKLPTNCLNVFDHFVGLALKELRLYGDNQWSTPKLFGVVLFVA